MFALRLGLTISLIAAAAIGSPSIADAGTFKTVYEFGSTSGDTRSPEAPLIAKNGLLYGTSTEGGPEDGGTIYTFNPSRLTEKVLTSGKGPASLAPVTYTAQTLFGTAYGPSSVSEIYGADPKTGVTTVLYSFGEDVVLDALLSIGGRLYGSAFGTGKYGNGSVFEFDPGTSNYTDLYSFTGGADGQYPENLVLNAGQLYGETLSGGSAGAGTIFTVNPATGAETTLYTFTGAQDGGAPTGITFYKGVIYGITRSGGAGGNGTVFALNPSTLQFSTVYAFPASKYGDCGLPASPVIESGRLYGTNLDCYGYTGTLYEIDLKSGRKAVLHTFSKGSGGNEPEGGLLDYKGVIYGTTSNSGTFDDGTIFTYTP